MHPWFRQPLIVTFFACLHACGGSSGGNSAPLATQPVPAGPTTTAAVQPPGSIDPESEPVVVVRVLALYSTGASIGYPNVDLRINHLFNVANSIAENGNVPVQFELAQIAPVQYSDNYLIIEALEALTFATDPAFAQIATLRDQSGADLVTLFRPYNNDGLCGYAWVGGYQTGGNFSNAAESDFGYSVVAIDCSDYTLLHEFGHNLGLVHSRREDLAGGSFPYGAGHAVDNDFVTIIASPLVFNAVRLPLLSSPDSLCNGQACGVGAHDPTQGADAAMAINQVIDQVAAYRN